MSLYLARFACKHAAPLIGTAAALLEPGGGPTLLGLEAVHDPDHPDADRDRGPHEEKGQDVEHGRDACVPVFSVTGLQYIC